MNIIKINNDQYKQLETWEAKNKDLVATKFYPYLLDGKMQIEINSNVFLIIFYNINIESKNGYKIDFDIHQNLFNKTDELAKLNFAIIDGVDTINNIDLHLSRKTKSFVGKDYIESTMKAIVGVFRLVNAYFFNYKQDVSELEIKEIERKGKIVKGKFKYQEVKHLNKHYTIKNPISNKRLPKARQWHLDSWGVVGHIRHYKDGKSVYVKPYTKGKGRLDNNKIYTI